ncbi:CheR-type MCP methyltransferase [Nitrosospira sp. Nsp2]|nr:CheR-type MCP methyltransferase [Nitrosospira sp. Nsp2]
MLLPKTSMQSALAHPLFSQLSRLLEKEMGLYYPAKSWGDLERRIAAAAPALGTVDAESCIRQLLSASLTRQQLEILAGHLTVGETYFFRETGSFDVLEECILPELMRARARSGRQLRIWSAGCCTGEEPYSIAILLDRLSQHTADANATILATDINPAFLEKAAKGLYGEWSFRATPPWIKERYFKRRKNGQFEILPHIRKRVTFSYLNLAEEIYPDIINGADAMDVIFCRNVLMYFSPDSVMKIGKNFYRSLVNGGWLILSPVELGRDLFPQFKQTTFPTAIFYQKATIAEPSVTIDDHSTWTPVLQQDAANSQAQALPLFLLGEDEKMLRFSESVATEHLIERVAMPDQAAEPRGAASKEDDETFEMLCDTARSYANLGKLAEAASWCEKAIAVNKLNPAARYLLATINQELGQSTTAMQLLRKTLYLDPDFVLAHFALGNLCMSHDRTGEAERHFDNALALLSLRPYDELLPESNGLTARRLTDIITSARSSILPVSLDREAQ